MSEAWLEDMARFYGIDRKEAARRYQAVTNQADNPEDPICIGCAKRPHELNEYLEAVGYHLNTAPTISVEVSCRRYVIHNEGTYNRRNGHFLCTDCYIRNGQPSSPRGWRAP